MKRRSNKRSMKGFVLALTVMLCAGITLSGCNIVTVNAQRERDQVFMTVDGNDVTKSVYNCAMAYMDMYYQSSGGSMPTGTKLKTLKSNMKDEIVQTQVLAAKAKKDGLTVDEASAKASGKSSYDSIKSKIGTKYSTILSDWNIDDDIFSAYMQDNAVDTEYADKALTTYQDSIKANPDDYLNTSVGTASGEDVTRGEYNYYYIGQEITTYSTTGSALATDDDTKKQTNETIFNTIGLNRQLIQYCSDNNIEITDSAVSSAQKTLNSTISMFFTDDSTLGSFLESYNLTVAKFREYQKEEAKANAATDAITQKLTDDVSVSDSDLKSYYNDNKNNYDTSTVSACHILTTDQDLANEIYDAAKDCTSKEDFQKVMDQYKSNSGVTEAKDLGAFTYKTMTEAFSKQAFSMDVNTVSKPVQTDYGYHVIFVYDKNDANDNWENHKDQLTEDYKSEKGSAAYDDLKNSLQSKAKISVGDIKTLTEQYVDDLKTELNVTVHDNVIG